MSVRSLNVVIGGEAGQGLATIGQLLGKVLTRAGYSLVVSQSYMSRIRGGHNNFTLRVSLDEITAPVEKIDLLLALNQETAGLYTRRLGQGSLVVGDEGLDLPQGACAVPFSTLAGKRELNVAGLGVLAGLLGLDQELAARAVAAHFGHKHAEYEEANRQALVRALAWAAEHGGGEFRLGKPANAPGRVMMNGNEAIAFGALSAGVKFCSFYPMTPATSVPLNLAAWAAGMNLVVEQAEDELAAVNMAIGASFAGGVALTATSGGGFALMTEGVSLAGMTETPLVVVVAQRPGPATGLPTRTAQADLECVLHAGHGEFPRAVFAPGDVGECFHLARQAVFTAHEAQTPVFILTDQYLADSYRALKPFDLDGLAALEKIPLDLKPSQPYQRYSLAAGGVSPRLLPGFSHHLVVADSDAHTADGHLTEDLAAALAQTDKRLAKTEALAQGALAPQYHGQDEPELLFVCWGSTKGAVREAVDRLGQEGGPGAAMLHFSQVWPLDPGRFLDRLKSARRVIAVEGNATAQLARIIAGQTGFVIKERLPRYDGLPFTAAYILDRF